MTRQHTRGLIAALGVALLMAVPAMAEPMVINGDFESDFEGFTVWPGYAGAETNPAEISGWTGGGGRGINPITADHESPAPFRDNGDNDTHVAFLQGDSYIEQTVSGFSPGTDYVLSLDFNSRNCCGDFPIGIVSLNGTEVANSADLFPAPGAILPASEANGGEWYSADIDFTADTEDIVVRISTMPSAAGDSTMVVDNIAVRVVPEPSSAALLMLGFALLGRLRRR